MDAFCRKVEHPSYRAKPNPDYDFALLLMADGGGFNLPNLPNVKPACLPTQAVPRNVNVSEEGN